MPTEELGSIRQQVVSLERGYHEIREDMRGVRSEMKGGFADIISKIDNRTTTNWQPIISIAGVAVTILIALGGALYMPVRETMVKHETNIETLRNQVVPRVEHERLWDGQIRRDTLMDERMRRLWEEDRKVNAEFNYLRGQLNPLKDK